MFRKPKLGQNFLVDDSARTAIADALGDIRNRTVIEIGPGHGAITSILTTRCRRLIALELDPTLVTELQLHFRHAFNVEVVHADILKTDLASLVPPTETVDIVGNLPYYITSEILLHLVAHYAAIDRAVLMVQREVAERLAASPGTSDYGVLSATMQLYGSVELLFTLSPSAFAPPPEVYSSVLRFHVRPRFDELGVAPESIQSQFIPFIRASFAQKRKTWANNLRNAGYHAGAIAAALAEAGLNANVRAEAVDLPGMATVFRALGAS
jgi:16S rRNA (adenine1518-N6/adenine1519-N6)-dimethyltransferase